MFSKCARALTMAPAEASASASCCAMSWGKLVMYLGVIAGDAALDESILEQARDQQHPFLSVAELNRSSALAVRILTVAVLVSVSSAHLSQPSARVQARIEAELNACGANTTSCSDSLLVQATGLVFVNT